MVNKIKKAAQEYADTIHTKWNLYTIEQFDSLVLEIWEQALKAQEQEVSEEYNENSFKTVEEVKQYWFEQFKAQEQTDVKVGSLVKRFGEVVAEKQKYKELYEQECTNHYYTRLSWERTCDERDKLKSKEQKQHIIDIMQADQKDGLYVQEQKPVWVKASERLPELVDEIFPREVCVRYLKSKEDELRKYNQYNYSGGFYSIKEKMFIVKGSGKTKTERIDTSKIEWLDQQSIQKPISSP